jgi:hypothetical protein
MPTASAPELVTLLPPGGSLARGLPPCPSQTLFVLGSKGGVRVHPDCSMAIVFGRNEPEVHVCVGVEDKGVSRRQGLLTRSAGRWLMTNTGRAPIRLADSRILLQGHEYALPVAYTPLYIHSGRRRDHVLEIRVAGVADRVGPGAAHNPTTTTGLQEPWRITEVERLVLVCLAQRYLAADRNPQPLAWRDVSRELEQQFPGQSWGVRRVETVVRRVRTRLSERGVPGLTLEEVGEPVGNALNHNLILELVLSTTLVAPDLELLS